MDSSNPGDVAVGCGLRHPGSNECTQVVRETVSALKSKGKLLIVVPKLHVSANDFLKTVQADRLAGLKTISVPKIFLSRSMLFELL
ncbi:MAG TPA: hypothetical protein VMY43_01925 [Methanothrix sp.]|nr:hypothetical protein [Methanothrix sp.]